MFTCRARIAALIYTLLAIADHKSRGQLKICQDKCVKGDEK
jgi:hypothetical protein